MTILRNKYNNIYRHYIDLLYYGSIQMNNIARVEVETGKKQTPENLPAWLQLVRKQVGPLKFGTMHITVHDAHVVQVERVEKLRFDKPEQSAG
jgi:hypothetical protein